MPNLFDKPRGLPGPAEKPFTVLQLTHRIKDCVELEFADVLVEGEISGWKPPNQRGHVYFDLVEGSEAKLPCALFASDYARLPAGISFRDGLKVIARGGLSVHPPFGRYQFAVRKLMPSGVGEAELKLRQLKEKLLGLGWFDADRKKPLPEFPKRVGMVTSRAGAAVRDMLQVLRERWPLADVILAPVPVQGEHAPAQIAQAVVVLNQLHQSGKMPLSVILLGRGGGAADDLWAFNDERVAHAIFHSVVPVISAVGHEIDVTIADLVADARAKTPTEAAMLATPDRRALLDDVHDSQERMRAAVRRQVDDSREFIESLMDRAAFRRPRQRIRDFEVRVDELNERISAAMRRTTKTARDKLTAIGSRLDSLSPLNILSRGYSLTMDEHGELLRDAGKLKPGQRLTTRLSEGRMTSLVETIEPK